MKKTQENSKIKLQQLRYYVINVQTFTGSRTHYNVHENKLNQMKIYSNYDTTCMQTFLNTTQVNDLCQQSYATTKK